MAASDGGHVWPPRASDLRIQELTGAGPEASKPDNVFAALRLGGYTGSLDDMWKQHLASKSITDTSEPFTDAISITPFLGGDDWPTASGYNMTATLQLTDGTGGAGGTGLDPILDVIDSVSRRLTGLDFSPDGLNCVCCAYSGIIASFSLSTAFDLSTATQTGSNITGVTLANNVRFNDDGTYITYLETGDQMRIRSLATAYTVASTDTADAATITKAEMGCVGSNDPIAAMAVDGTGIWVYGTADSGTTFTLKWVPLSTAYDFSTNGTVVESTTSHGNLHNGPTASSIIGARDGKAVFLFAGTHPENLNKFVLSTAFDPDTETYTTSSEWDIAQAYSMMVWNVDMTQAHAWNAIFVTAFDSFNLD